jgi:MazG family protein
VADLKEEFARLCAIVAQLRAPGGCPWDREQTHASLAPALIEETYEAVSAISAADDANLREELGDVLLLVVMHAEIARESGRFEIGDLIAQVTEKLIRRHPHVFGTSDVKESDAVVRQWETIKQDEKKTTSDHYLDDLPAAFPALMRAEQAQRKAARVQFDWTKVGDVLAKVDEEFGEAKEAIASGDQRAISDEIGDLLFAVTNLARKCKLDAESTLQAATDKFVARFNALEDRLRERGKELGDLQLEELDQIWNELKQTFNAQRSTFNIQRSMTLSPKLSAGP